MPYSIDDNINKQDSTFINMMSELTNIKKTFKHMMVQYQHLSLDKVEPTKAQGYDTSSLVTDPFTIFTPYDQYHVPIKWGNVFSCDDIEEY